MSGEDMDEYRNIWIEGRYRVIVGELSLCVRVEVEVEVEVEVQVDVR